MKKVRHLLTIRDLNAQEIQSLFKEAARLKKAKGRTQPLRGKTLGLMFQKPSVRTKVSFEVGMNQLGGQTLYMGPVELEQGKRESAKDLARVLSRYLDGIVARTFGHEEVVEMAQWATIPVINGLSDESHPCQALADLFTIQEKRGKLRGLQMAYVGDGNNVCHSLIETAALTGLHLAIATPTGYEPKAEVIQWAQAQARKTGSRITLTQNPKETVKGAAIVYTDVWTSMGQEKERQQRQRIFLDFQVNRALMQQAAKGALFMHCLPAHRGEEVSDELMDSKQAIVYDQAENRLHLQKAILLMLLEGK